MRSTCARYAAAAATPLAALLLGSGAATAQSSYDDMACRQYADAQVAPLRGQVSSQAFGSTLFGAGLGAAVGGAVGGGRGAGIGAASGALVGGMSGAASAQNAEGYIAQQYNAYYAQCMQARSAPPPPGYAPAAPSSADQLNRQQLYQQQYPYR